MRGEPDGRGATRRGAPLPSSGTGTSAAPSRACAVAQDETFGRYRLLERLGEGGMAEVFKAKSFGVEGFEKVLVIKRILPELAAHPRVRRHVRARGEARGAPLARQHRAGVRPRPRRAARRATRPATSSRWSTCPGSTSRRSSRAAARQDAAAASGWPSTSPPRSRKALDHAHRRRDEQPAPARHRPPRHLAAERPPLVGGRGEGHRLRHRQGEGHHRRATSDATSSQAGRVRGKLAYMSPEQSRARAGRRRAAISSRSARCSTR